MVGKRRISAYAVAMLALVLTGCAVPPAKTDSVGSASIPMISDSPQSGSAAGGREKAASKAPEGPTAEELRAKLSLAEDMRPELAHGPKPAENQRYIVLHDTEGDMSPEETVNWWAGNGNLVAAHFVIGKDGRIVQCVPIDQIAHHAGFGDAGKNDVFGITDDGRDDKLGTRSIGDAYPDYALNAWSVGIELVHVGGSGDYPTAQLEALDGLIAYLDAYYGFESQITDHKAWRASNSDTSAEFAAYLANYQDHRTHLPV